jgi:glycosyltransferase involved in cell wall biosynthesis
MKVLHIMTAPFGAEGVIGGAERYALELAGSMAERVPTTLLAFGARSRREQRGALQIITRRNWIHAGRFRLNPLNLAAWEEFRRADVLHCHQTHSFMASAALLYGKASGKPVFTTHLGGGGWSLHKLSNVDAWYAGHLHISQFSRTAFGHQQRANAEVILGGVDTAKFSPAEGSPRDRVLFVGRLLPHKGVNYLIEAVDERTPLVIVGRRWPHAARFYDLLRRLAAGKDVTFCEDCGDPDLIAHYRRALCIVLPSVQQSVFGERHAIPELLGQTLLEGMACGAPAICTNICSLPEIVEDGVSGFIIPPNDPAALRDRIAWLQQHRERAREMGRAARQRVLRDFRWQSVVERCLAAYERALRESRGSRQAAGGAA